MATIVRLLLAVTLAWSAAGAAAPDALPSWNDTAPKKAIAAFVARVTTTGSPDFVPAARRIAVFDNDGTLWSEQPVYTQVFFLMDRITALAPQHPEWAAKEPFASVLEGDLERASVDDGRQRRAVRAARPSHGRRTRVGLRPRLRGGPARSCPGRSESQRLDGGRHEAGLASGFRAVNDGHRSVTHRKPR